MTEPVLGPRDHGDDHYDAVVAGGGPAGCAAALVLARAGRSVLLADAGTGAPKIGEALVGAARTILDDLGVGDRVPGPGHLPCHGNTSAWGSSALHTVDFIRDPYGLGWHLDRPVFDRRLRDCARAAGADVAERTAVRRPRRRGAGWTVDLRGPAGVRAVDCAWVVDATGRAAAIAAHCGARRDRRDRLIATYLTLGQDSAAADTRSLVESDPDGWWYTALLPSRRRLLTYFTDADLPSAALQALPAFRQRLSLTRHTAPLPQAHGFPGHTAPRRAAAHSARLDPVCGDGWIAAGDAAAAFDPLSSQGILTALYSGLRAGEAVDGSLRGKRQALETYAASMASVLNAYTRDHRTTYAMERRWPWHPFWARRLGTG
ncbi:oxidoreductase [Streptomyces piniterrae]|uniref:Oxidoreductase n=1 Tax=Streptomyces piniterrae TaxID=2571125 RepID=A0A4U0P7D0_9ACTN|nr:FAD-dependent monooxygenase [Streptomyces piniterrae]TJZ58664.1 oxidoreductase [Streptomyces piniterrae]